MQETLRRVLGGTISALLPQKTGQLITIKILLESRSIISLLGKPLGGYHIDSCFIFQLWQDLLHTKVLIERGRSTLT